MFTLTIRTENAAFGSEPHYELARILSDLASRVGGGQTEGTVQDENGGTVGRFKLTGDKKGKG